MIQKVTYGLAAWMACVLLGLTLFLSIHPLASSYFRWGPHSDFKVFGISIDTSLKYTCLSFYCWINSGFRALHHNVIQPWILHSIQSSKEKVESISFAYTITVLSTSYFWLDWFMYMNLLLSQVDMMLYEFTADVCIAMITTRYYILHQHKKDLSIPPSMV